MEKTLKIINEMKKIGLIKDYAIGGGIATMYYVEPILTYDLDIFFIPTGEGLNIPIPIYDYLKKRGYKSHEEHIIIEGVPVLFIPVYNNLVKEGVEKAVETKYRRAKTKIFQAEYLIAVALQTYRPRDRERMIKLLDEAEIDMKYLEEILKKHLLYERFVKFKEQYFEK